VAQINADAAGGRIDLALQRGAGTERDHRHAVLGAQAHHVLDVFGFLRHHHGIRRLRGEPRSGMGMLLAHRLRRDQPVAEPRRQRFDRALQGLRFRPLQIACYRCRHVKIPPGFGGRWQRIYKGSRTRLRLQGETMTTATARELKLPTAPFVSSVMQLEPQWIDYNRHLNMAYYNVLMDRAI